MNFITILQEMAAVHLDNKVADLMIAGDIEGAVKEYIKNIIQKKATLAKSSSATTKKLKEGRPPKSIKISAEKLEQIPAKSWDKFDEIYKVQVNKFKPTEGGERKQSKGTTVKTRSGEEIVITSGQKQKVIKDELATKIIALIKEREADMEKEDDPKKQEDIDSHLRALHAMLEGLNATRSGRALFDADQKELQKRYKKIGDEYKKKYKMESVNESSDIIGLVDELISLTDNPKEKKSFETMKRKLSAIVNKKVLMKENTSLDMNYSIKMMALMEGENYRGTRFAENYMFSAFAKAFRKDSNKYGVELTEEIYESIYGKNICVITDAIKNNKEFFEAIDTKDSPLLFEGYSFNEELTESVWDVIKQFGGSAIGRMKGFLGQGLGWAKELMSKGIGFFTELPIAQIAIPALALAGSAAGAIKLINSIRKKAKENPLSKEEKEKFKEAIKNNKEEALKYTS